MKIKCPVCKKENSPGSEFCRHCRYPIGIKKISELSRDDISQYLLGLLDVICKERKSLFKDKASEALYDELLSLYWLRPESALLRFIEARIMLNYKRYFKYPALDMGCGDGLFTAILFGARINKEYDSFRSMDFAQSDPYNSYTKLPDDIFEKRPRAIGFGVDIKENSVRRARELDIYDKVMLGDIRKLPFGSGVVNSVFSNMIDDIKEADLSNVFKEVGRVIKRGGYFIFTSPTENFRKYLYFYNKGNMRLDRERSAWQPRPLSLWKTVFERTSFQIIKVVDYGKANLIRFWDTGFRPFFYHSIALRSLLKENKCDLTVKKIYLEMSREYFYKYVENQVAEGGAFRIIISRKI